MMKIFTYGSTTRPNLLIYFLTCDTIKRSRNLSGVRNRSSLDIPLDYIIISSWLGGGEVGECTDRHMTKEKENLMID